MNHLRQGLRILAVTITLMLPWSATQALDTFEKFGMISTILPDSFVVNDQVYRIHPGVRFTSNDATRQQVSDLGKGDMIVFSGNILSGIYYVDYIGYSIDEPS